MKKLFSNYKLRGVPEPLKDKIMLRLGIGAFAAIFGVALILCMGFYIGFAWLLLGIYMMGSGVVMARVCATEKYTTITGVCRKIETSAFRRRIKSVELLMGRIPVKVRIHQPAHISVQEGDLMEIYTSDREPVYVRDGCNYLCGYYALVVADRAIQNNDTE